MIINVRVIAGSRQTKITVLENGDLKIHTNAQPEKGNANAAVIKILSAHFKKPVSDFEIIRGETAADKVIRISDQFY